jgi:hypothetical protein
MVLLVLLIRFYLPSYFNKKGENLATKQDIEAITRKTEAVQQEFREGFKLFSSDIEFKYEFNYKRYSNLYCKLYGIVMQSEHIKHMLELVDGKAYYFEEYPFIEISPTKKVTTTFNGEGNEPMSMKRISEEFETPISKFNKETLCNYIIEGAEYASQELLKLAVGYRFVQSNVDSQYKSEMEAEEFRLISEIVKHIVKEYNELRRDLNMTYDKDEFDTGVPSLLS